MATAVEEKNKSRGPLIPVEFEVSTSPYSKGEVAGFSEQTVQRLEKRDVVRRLSKEEVATGKRKGDARKKRDAEKAMDNAPIDRMMTGGRGAQNK